MVEKLLEVKNLRTYFYIREGVLRAVDGLSYSANKGEFVALVGESACGKSVSALSIMRLIPYPRESSWAEKSSLKVETCSNWVKKKCAPSEVTVAPWCFKNL
jgi:ABC-type dipeptide/oligopeptide/nickel transport system ATPase component